MPPGKQPAGYAIYAVPAPVTDGKRVYVWFGSALLAALDFEGKIVWRKERDGPFSLNPGICSSSCRVIGATYVNGPSQRLVRETPPSFCCDITTRLLHPKGVSARFLSQRCSLTAR